MRIRAVKSVESIDFPTVVSARSGSVTQRGIGRTIKWRHCALHASQAVAASLAEPGNEREALFSCVNWKECIIRWSHEVKWVKTVFRSLFLVLLGCFALVIFACGGGSSSSVPPPTPDFALLVNPSSLAANAGAQTQTAIVSLSAFNGFSGSVSVTAALPAGFSCVNSACNGQISANATLPVQFTVSQNVAGGNYPVTFTGTSGTLSHQASLTINVTVPPPPDFSISVSPASLSAVSGNQTQAAVVSLTSLNGFASTVSVTASLPPGITCAIASCTGQISSQSTLQVQYAVAPGVTAGSYAVTLTGVSGSLSHQATLTINVSVPPPPDFSITVTPPSVNAVAGTNTQPAALSVTALNGFAGTVSIAETLPQGVTCALASCTGQISPAATLPFQYTLDSTLGPGSYSATFTATSGTISHTASFTINVTAPPVQLNHSGYVYNTSGGSAIYDSVHDLIFATNYDSCEIDVISPETLKVVYRIPVPEPTSLDLSPDSSILYVGTNTDFVFEVGPTLHEVVGRIPFPGAQVLALSDGTLMLGGSYGTMLWIYTPSTQTLTEPALPVPFSTSIAFQIFRSPDRQHVFATSVVNSGQLLRYDVATRSFTAGQAAPDGDFFGEIATKPDDTAAASVIGGGKIVFFDSNFNTLATVTALDSNGQPAQLGGDSVFSPDGSLLYVSQTTGESTETVLAIDSKTFQAIGEIPDLTADGAPYLTGWDGQHRLLGTSANGVDLVDASITPTMMSPNALNTSTGGVVLSPDNDANGFGTTLFYNFTQYYSDQIPLITFNGTPATNVTPGFQQSASVATLEAPALQNTAQADVDVLFPSGYFFLAPLAYSYKPTAVSVQGNASATTGGTAISITGFGFDEYSNVSMTIGGNAATSVSGSGRLISPYPVPLDQVSGTTPAGDFGTKDITVTTPIGSVTIPGGFTYISRTDFSLPSTAAPFQLILDKPRGRLIWTDDVANQLMVYSLTSNQIVQQIAVGNQPAGVALTPDGSKILVVLYGDKALKVYDADNYSLLQQAPTPNPATTEYNSCNVLTCRPEWVAAVANQKAFLVYVLAGYGDVPVVEYDIPSNSFTLRTDAIDGGGGSEAASADGNTAFVAGYIWTAATDTFTAASGADCVNTCALSADGENLIQYRAVYGPDSLMKGVVASEGFIGTSINGQKLNATGSLSYMPTPLGISVLDVRHGATVRTISLPNYVMTLQSPSLYIEPADGIAVDPDGQVIYFFTSSGLTTLTFPNDPLSIGEVQASGTQLTILGSGFVSGAVVQLDGTVISSTVEDTQHILATASALSAGAHNITITLPSGATYSLDNALETEARVVF